MQWRCRTESPDAILRRRPVAVRHLWVSQPTYGMSLLTMKVLSGLRGVAFLFVAASVPIAKKDAGSTVDAITLAGQIETARIHKSYNEENGLALLLHFQAG